MADSFRFADSSNRSNRNRRNGDDARSSQSSQGARRTRSDSASSDRDGNRATANSGGEVDSSRSTRRTGRATHASHARATGVDRSPRAGAGTRQVRATGASASASGSSGSHARHAGNSRPQTAAAGKTHRSGSQPDARRQDGLQRSTDSRRTSASGQRTSRGETQGAKQGIKQSSKQNPRQNPRQNPKQGSNKSIKQGGKPIVVKGGGKGGFSPTISMPTRMPKGIPTLKVILVLVLLFAAFCIYDHFATENRIYSNIHIGSVDVSGMTQDEAVKAVNSKYQTALANNTAHIYRTKEAMQSAQTNPNAPQDNLEDLSVEEAAAKVTHWTANSSELDATLPTQTLVAAAYETGRSDGGVFGRIITQLFGKTLDVYCEYNETALQSLADTITLTMGTKRVDSSIVIENGIATAVEGSDGIEVDVDWLADQLDDAYFNGNTSFVAQVSAGKQRVTYRQAQDGEKTINTAIAPGGNLFYGTTVWGVDASTLGSWIVTGPVKEGNGYALSISLDPSKVSTALQERFGVAGIENLRVTMRRDEEGVWVGTNQVGQVPDVDGAIEALTQVLFESSNHTSPFSITVRQTTLPAEISFNKALAMGIIENISSYTTTYSTYEGTEARNHNIHLAADKLNGVIVPANNGVWSFNTIVGDTNEAASFQSAGSIVAGEYQDSIGGGICQVATTVFNSVYEAGYPVSKRYNHSLYIASYPAGRDAAINWDDLDLEWENDSPNDLLVTMSYTDSTLTCDIWGISPHYVVTTEESEWEEGDRYKIIQKVDESLEEGYSYVQTSGEDGSKITVTQRIYDQAGTLLRTRIYVSTYSPKDEVVVTGPNTKIDTERKDLKEEEEKKKEEAA